MSFLKWANKLVKKLDWIDVKLVAFAGIFIGILLVRWIPFIAEINVWYFIVLGGLSLAKVYYVIFSK